MGDDGQWLQGPAMRSARPTPTSARRLRTAWPSTRVVSLKAHAPRKHIPLANACTTNPLLLEQRVHEHVVVDVAERHRCEQPEQQHCRVLAFSVVHAGHHADCDERNEDGRAAGIFSYSSINTDQHTGYHLHLQSETKMKVTRSILLAPVPGASLMQ